MANALAYYTIVSIVGVKSFIVHADICALMHRFISCLEIDKHTSLLVQFISNNEYSLCFVRNLHIDTISQHLTRLEKLEMDKHSSLLVPFIQRK
jgi:hypothetical protein